MYYLGRENLVWRGMLREIFMEDVMWKLYFKRKLGCGEDEREGEDIVRVWYYFLGKSEW